MDKVHEKVQTVERKHLKNRVICGIVYITEIKTIVKIQKEVSDGSSGNEDN